MFPYKQRSCISRWHSDIIPISYRRVTTVKMEGKCIPLFNNNFYISVGCAHNVVASGELATYGQTTSIEGIETIGEGGNDVAVYHFNHWVGLSGESRDGSRGLGGDICFLVGSNFKSILPPPQLYTWFWRFVWLNCAVPL